jgi:hypothetical protein
LLQLLKIEGTDTNFVRGSSAVSFLPSNAIFRLPPFVMDSDTILMFVYVMPKLLTDTINNVEVTVTTGTELASADLEIKLLLFPLEEGNAKLE